MEESPKHIGYLYLDFNVFLVTIKKLSKEKRKEYFENFKNKAEERRAFVELIHNEEKQNNKKSGSEVLILDLYNEFYNVLRFYP